MTIKRLMETRDAIYLQNNEAKDIWEEKSDKITKGSSFKGYLGKSLYLIGGDLCYGVVILKNEKTSDDKFIYDVELIKRFDIPAKIKFNYQTKDDYGEIEFLTDNGATAQTDIRGTGFKASPLAPFAIAGKKRKKRRYKIDGFEFELDDEVKELFVRKKGNRWCVTHSDGRIIKCFPTKEEADRMHKAIIISKIRRGKMEEMIEQDILDKFEDFKVIKDFISVVGSQVKNPGNHKPKDIDLQIRMSKPNDYLKRAIEVRLLKMLPEDIQEKIHFIWGDPEGAHDDFLPLYDLKLEKIKSDITKMDEREDFGQEEVDLKKKLINSDEHWDINLPPTLDFIIDFSKIVKKIKGNRILDIGCGAGHAMKSLKRAGYDVKGIDINDKAIKHCESEDLDAEKMDAENIEFADKSFDTVFSMHVLEHLDNPDKAIEESIRLSKNAVIHVIPLGKRIPKEHKRVYYDKDIEDIAQRYGFEYLIYNSSIFEQKDNAILWKIYSAKEMETAVYQKPRYRLDEPDEIFDLKGFERSVVQVKFDGARIVIKKKGDDIKLLSEDVGADKSKLFPKLADWIKKNLPDCTIDTEAVAVEDDEPLLRTEVIGYLHSKDYDEEKEDMIQFFAVDIMGYKNIDTSKLPYSDRLEFLDKIKKSDKLIPLGNKNLMGEKADKKDIPKAVNKIFKDKFAEGAMIKDITAPIKAQNTGMAKIKIWMEIDLRVLEKIRNKAGSLNYIVGTKISEEHAEAIGKRAIRLGDKYYMRLTKTMNTKIDVGVNAIIRLRITEVHKEMKDNKPLYTLFIPRVHSDQSKTRAIEDGLEVLESLYKKSKKPLLTELEDEEGEPIKNHIKNFSRKMQASFRKVMESREWNPFVAQWHLRGQKSLHTDLRFKIDNYLEGFSLFTPPSIDKPDLLTENPQNIRGTIKPSQPIDWLKVEGRFPSGAPGTTKEFPAYFAIVAKGKYKIHEVTDHKIIFELKSDSGIVKKPTIKKGEEYAEAFIKKLPNQLKQLSGLFSFHIAHIGERYIFLFDKIKR